MADPRVPDFPRFLLRLLLASAVAVAAAGTAVAAVVESPLHVEAAKVRRLLLDGKFAELDAYERRARDLSLTLSDGQQLHAAYGDAINCSCSFRNGREELEQFRTRIAEWRAAYPDSVSAQIAEAAYFVQHAWYVRGNGSAGEVAESAWPVFRRDVAEAARLMDATGAQAREQPDWYVVRLDIMKLQGAEKADFARLLDEALARHPWYLPIYFEGGQYYQPRWHGSVPELDAFIERALAITRERWGETMYARLQWSNWQNMMFRDGQADWKRMKGAFERLTADYPDSWNVNAFGNFACIALDPQTTRELLGKMNGSIALEVWGSMEFYAKCKAWALRKTAAATAQ